MERREAVQEKSRSRDLTGMQFGRLTVLERRGSKDRQRMWLCRCSCGNERAMSTTRLLTKNRKSCGCIAADKARNRTKHGCARAGKLTPEFRTWVAMRERCTSQSHSAYPQYGGAGVRVCERWSEFQNFLSDMGPKPSPKHSIDRIDNTKGYSPENCRWATRIQQNNNTQRNRMVTFQGVTKTMAEWARELGVNYYALRGRLNRLPPEIAFVVPKFTRNYDKWKK